MARNGFSLIELAIALVVVGLLVVPLTRAYHLYTIRKATDDTYGAQGMVSSALSMFFAENGRYPCPASRTTATGAADHGREICPGASPTAGSCSNGLCRATGRDVDGDGAPETVLIGAVPYADLNISVSNALDGYKRRLTYAVSERLTSSTTFNDRVL